jgi:hypothetical protein
MLSFVEDDTTGLGTAQPASARACRATRTDNTRENGHDFSDGMEGSRNSRRGRAVGIRGQLRGAGAKDQGHGLHRHGKRSARALQAGSRGRQPRHRDRLGAGLDRRRHGALPRREGQPPRRHRVGPCRLEPRAFRRAGAARALHAARREGSQADVQERQEPGALGGDGRLSGGDLLQHRGSRQGQCAETRHLERSHQPGLQGQGGDAAPGLLRHRLSHHRGLAPADGRGEGLAIHGQAPRQHRGLHAFRLRALRAGGARRALDRHRLRYARRLGEDQGRPNRPRRAEGRHRLGDGGDGHRQGHEEHGGGEEGRRLGRDPESERALRQVLRDRRPPGREGGAAELSHRGRGRDGEERPQLDGDQPRAHPRRVVEALRGQRRHAELPPLA